MMDFLIQKVYAADTSTGFSNQSNAATGFSNQANTSTGFSNQSAGFDTLLTKILTNIVNPLILLLMALAVVYFLAGVVKFIQNADNPTEREEGYQHMIWGIVGIFIMVSALGIKNLIGNIIGL